MFMMFIMFIMFIMVIMWGLRRHHNPGQWEEIIVSSIADVWGETEARCYNQRLHIAHTHIASAHQDLPLLFVNSNPSCCLMSVSNSI